MSSCIVALALLCAALALMVPAQCHILTRSDDDSPLAVVVNQLSRDLQTLKAQVEAQQNEIVALRSEYKSAQKPVVAFSAYISDHPSVKAAEGAIVPFRGLLTNTGGGYSTSTSSFTTPVAGYYFFIVNVDCSPDMRSLLVNVNGNWQFAADNDNHDGHVTGSGVLYLHKGDVVTTTYYAGTGHLDAGGESTFSGFLVK